MSIRFLCRNGQKTTVAKVYLVKMSLFRKYPELAKLDSYQLRCDADLNLLNFFLDKVYDESSVVGIDEINEDNFDELKALSTELGFSKFDDALRAFEGHQMKSSVEDDRLTTFETRINDFERKVERELAQVKASVQKVDGLERLLKDLSTQIKRHEQRCQNLERRCSELEREKMKADNEWRESVSRQIQGLERRVEEVSRGCEQQSSAVSRRTEQGIKECAKQSDFDALTRVVEQLQRSDEELRAHIKTMTPAAVEPTLKDRLPHSSPKPAAPPAPAKPAAPPAPVKPAAPPAPAKPAAPPAPAKPAAPPAPVKPAAPPAPVKPAAPPAPVKPAAPPAPAKPAAPPAPVKPAAPPAPVKPAGASGTEFVYDDSNPLRGVIAYLARECNGNVHRKGIVNVTASSTYPQRFAENVVDLEKDTEYWSQNENGTWICYDFKNRRVIPTSYSLRSYAAGRDGHHLKSWVLEVSNDGTTWRQIDRQDNSDLNNTPLKNFKISPVPSESFRFFRLRQTGPNHSRSSPAYSLRLTAMEIFGTLCDRRT